MHERVTLRENLEQALRYLQFASAHRGDSAIREAIDKLEASIVLLPPEGGRACPKCGWELP